MSAIVEFNFKKTKVLLPMSEIITEVMSRSRAKGKLDLPVLSVNNVLGFIAQNEQFENREVASADTSNYKIITEGVIAYNPARINIGSVAYCEKGTTGKVSPMYVCFTTNEKALPIFVYLFLKSQFFQKEMGKRLEGSVRLCLSYQALCDISIPIPTLEEQSHIVKQWSIIRDKLNLEKSILSLLIKQKEYILRKMFI